MNHKQWRNGEMKKVKPCVLSWNNISTGIVYQYCSFSSESESKSVL